MLQCTTATIRNTRLEKFTQFKEMAPRRCVVVKSCCQMLLILALGVAHGGTCRVVGGSLLDKLLARKTRSAAKFMAGPDGSLCMLSPSAKEGSKTYSARDNLTELTCDLCRIGQVLESHCTTDRNTKCRPLIRGEERMPHPNFCNSGFHCKTCPGPSETVKQLCEPGGTTDTECKCAKDYFLVNGEADTCGRCSKGFEPQPRAGADGVDETEMICQKCKVGFYQPNDNSTDHCKIHTNCITTAGTDMSDNVCRGDLQSSESTATLSDEGAPSVEPTTPSTRVPIGPTSPMPIGVTDPPHQTGPTSPMPIGVTDPPHQTETAKKGWAGILCFFLCIFIYIMGILTKTGFDKWKKNQNDNNKKQDETELPLREAPAETDTPLVNLKTKKGQRGLRDKIRQRGGKRR